MRGLGLWITGLLAWGAGDHTGPSPSGGEPVPAGVYRCDPDELARVRNQPADAQPVLAKCLASAPEGSRVELPPGKYTLESPLHITGSLIQNALCGTGVEISGKRHSIVFRGNRIRDNGVHNTELLWADGVTVHDASNSTFEDNEFHDNTDVDFIFGGCRNCSIARNKITHSDRWARSSYVGLMLHAWPTTSGDYRGSTIEENRVDCGPKQNCGFGIYIGSSAWYKANPVVGGTFRGNAVSNAQTGVVLDDVHDMRIEENDVDGSGGGTFETSGGRRFSPAIVMTSKAKVKLVGNPPRPKPEQYTLGLVMTHYPRTAPSAWAEPTA